MNKTAEEKDFDLEKFAEDYIDYDEDSGTTYFKSDRLGDEFERFIKQGNERIKYLIKKAVEEERERVERKYYKIVFNVLDAAYDWGYQKKDKEELKNKQLKLFN